MTGKCYTPPHVIDPAAGTGGYLRHVHDHITGNPPYGGSMRITHDPGLYLSPVGQRVALALGKTLFVLGFGCLAVELIEAGILAVILWLLAAALIRYAEHSAHVTGGTL